MYAVIETGGKQYRVQPGDVIEVERLADADAAEEAKIEFDRVLMVRDDEQVKIGNPVVDGAKVTAVSVGEIRAPKITVFKMKRRKGYRRRRGHRQDLLQVRIEEING